MRRIKSSGLALALFLSSKAQGQGWLRETYSALGLELSQDLETEKLNHAQLFLEGNHTLARLDDPSAARFKLRYRLLVDSERQDTLKALDQDNVDKLLAYLEKPMDDFRISIGLQEVTWGENMLLPILDVVNPRNVDAVRGFYDASAKQGSPMVQLEWLSGEWEAQGIFVPTPQKSRQPESVGGFGINDQRQYRYPKDAEFGGKLGFLHEGVDTRVYYFKHHPREPSYRFEAFSSDREIQIDEEMVETTGATVSYAGYNWLFRGDFADHRNFAATSLAPKIERTRLDQAVLGLNWTSDSQQSLGVEWHNDFWEHLPDAFKQGAFVEKSASLQHMSWLGVTANLNFWQSKLEPQVFYLKGLNNNDQMLRAILQSNVSDHVTLGLEYQKTHAETTSPKLLLSQTEALSMRCTWAF